MSTTTTPTFMDRLKKILSKFKLDSHHQIERFGAMFFVVAMSGALVLTAAGVTAFQNSRETMGSTAIYTAGFQTSKTAVQGSVQGLYTSEDNTRAMLLMQFDEVSKISTNADNYQAFMTGINQNFGGEVLKGDPSGDIYVFGSTGYIGVLLENPEGFESQIINLTMRANEELVRPEEATKLDEDLEGDGTFASFDQWRLVFNPGASGTTTSKALSSGENDMRKLYDEMIIAPQEQELRETMDVQLDTMRTDLNAIEEYTGRLTSTKFGDTTIKAPEVPSHIAGDQILCNGTPIREAERDEAVCDPSEMSLKAEWTAPDGFDFDWRAGSVESGYLDALAPEGKSYLEFLSEHRSETYDDLKTSDIQWQIADGTLLEESVAYQTSSGPVDTVNENIALLTEAYNTYYNHKQDYQVGSYNKLLDLEVDLRDVDANYSENESDESVLVY